ncbi:MAG TPA: hypothetical protein VIK86_10330 [Candidatus Paceibacterota bacterium]
MFKYKFKIGEKVIYGFKDDKILCCVAQPVDAIIVKKSRLIFEKWYYLKFKSPLDNKVYITQETERFLFRYDDFNNINFDM